MKAKIRFALFSYGFRTFFFVGAVWATTSMLLWTAILSGHIPFSSPYGLFAWHAHEFLFGYVGTIVTGFLLTAIPNWTGRTPVQGLSLCVLSAIWLAGRVAIWFAGSFGPITAAVIDSCFLIAVTGTVLVELIAGKNYRNLKIAAILALLAACNIYFHFEVIVQGHASHSLKLALVLIVILIMLIGGRIIPSFTHNWLANRNSQNLPTSFNNFDSLFVSTSVLALVLWIVLPNSYFTGALLLLAALLQVFRLARWSGVQTLGEPLLFILHVGYFFIPLGFFAVGSSVLWPHFVPTGSAIHLWTTGAIGIMTLAMMTRVSRGHTGRRLTAPLATQIIFALILLSALIRPAPIFLPEYATVLLEIASYSWICAFAVFLIFYSHSLIIGKKKRLIQKL